MVTQRSGRCDVFVYCSSHMGESHRMTNIDVRRRLEHFVMHKYENQRTNKSVHIHSGGHFGWGISGMLDGRMHGADSEGRGVLFTFVWEVIFDAIL